MFETKRTIRYANTAVLTVSIVGILVAFNFLSAHHFLRGDLTETEEFTLAPSTKRILKELDDIVSIKVYFSKKLPPHLMSLRRQVYDLLEEYKSYGKGNIHIEYVDPGEDPNLARRVRFLGIPQLQVNIIEKDQVQVANIYLGMAVMYSDKKGVIPMVDSIETLEYDLTSTILKVTRDQPKTVGLLMEYGPHSVDKDYSLIREALEKQYRVIEVHLKEEKKIPDTIDTLVIAGCKEIDDEAKFGIDQFLMRGGRIVFLIDPMEIRVGTLQATKIDFHLDDMLEGYGIKVNHDLVLDRVHVMASFSSGFIRFHTPYPFWPKVLEPNFAQDQPMVSKLESLVLPWTSSLEASQKEGDSVKVITLAKTTPYAWRQKEYFDLSPRQDYRAMASNHGTFSLAMLASGRFKSFYRDKDVPGTKGKAGNILKESPETHIVVLGNSNFIADWFISDFQENMVFFLNVIDWLTLGEELIGIRSRGVTDRPLIELTDKQKAVIKFLNIFAVPALVGVFGLLRFYFRRKKKKVMMSHGI